MYSNSLALLGFEFPCEDCREVFRVLRVHKTEQKRAALRCDLCGKLEDHNLAYLNESAKARYRPARITQRR